MKKRTRNNLIILLAFIIIITVVSVLVVKKFNIGSSSRVEGSLKDKNDNVIKCSSDSFIHDYVHFMIESEKSVGINDGIEFEIINPKGNKVYSGVLEDDKIIRKRYDNIRGEWKIIFKLKDEESTMINSGFSIGSNDESTMKME